MKAPGFWQHPSLMARCLSPVAAVYGRMVQKRLRQPPDYTSRLPVICVGNIVMGGSGKTPVVQGIAKLLQEQKKNPAILLRGYGGEKAGPAWITSDSLVRDYGDESLLHARVAPTMVAADRPIGAKVIETNETITHIVMDDGLQNPSLKKDVSFLVLDADNPFGNGCLFPAGPLRETMTNALDRVQALIVLGEDKDQIAAQYQFLLPVFQAALQPVNPQNVKGKPVLAFAGIGRPKKFFDTLRACDAVLFETHSFPDHYAYTARDIAPLVDRAQKAGALPVTTRKDWVRLPSQFKEKIAVLDVELVWQDKAAIMDYLTSI